MRRYANILLGALMLTASAYTPMECGNNGVTADGTMARPGTCAVSRDLRHLMGQTIHIEGVGKLKVIDVMNARYRQSVDVCMADRVKALEFGRRKVAVKVIR